MVIMSDMITCAENGHTSVLPHEMEDFEPGENPTRTLTWKSLDFFRHIKSRTTDDRFPLPLIMGDLVLIQSRCTNSGSDWTSSTHVTLFIMIRMGIIWRRTKLNHLFYRFTAGL